MNTLHSKALVLAIALTAASAANSTGFRAGPTLSYSSASAGTLASRMLEGVWDEKITFVDCVGGGTLSSGRGQNMVVRGGSIVTTTAAPPNTQGPGFGTWRYQPPGLNYSEEFRNFMFNPATGAPTGYQVVDKGVVLSSDGNSSTSEVTFAIYDMTGAQLSSGCAVAAGTRILAQ